MGKFIARKNVMYVYVTLGPKTVNCHAMICNCNAVTMFPANALISTTVAQNKKVQQKSHSSKYLSAFLQAIRHQSRHPG